MLAGKEYGTGLVARLGREGPDPARRARGDRRELRAHPPLEPRRHGRPAAPVPGRREAASRSGSPAARSSRSRASRTAPRASSPCARDEQGVPGRVRIDTPRELEYFGTAGSSRTCCGASSPRNRIRRSAVVPVMGRGLLIALLAAVVLGALAVSGGARTPAGLGRHARSRRVPALGRFRRLRLRRLPPGVRDGRW